MFPESTTSSPSGVTVCFSNDFFGGNKKDLVLPTDPPRIYTVVTQTFCEAAGFDDSGAPIQLRLRPGMIPLIGCNEQSATPI